MNSPENEGSETRIPSCVKIGGFTLTTSSLMQVDQGRGHVQEGKSPIEREVAACYEQAANGGDTPGNCLAMKDRLYGQTLTAEYRKLLNKSKGAADRIRKEQRAWLKWQVLTCKSERNRFVEREGESVIAHAVEQACLLRTTMDRIR